MPAPPEALQADLQVQDAWPLPPICANMPRAFGHVLLIPDNFQELSFEFPSDSGLVQ